jgi:spore maturation protein CgeB
VKVIVLGMHRSGTSLASGLLSHAGVYFGGNSDFIQANEENPKGFWERKDVRILNDNLLHEMSCDWSEISNIYKKDISKKSASNFNSDASRIINDLHQHSTSGVIGLKEPRLCILMPFWQHLLDNNNFFLVVYRDPQEIAISLKNRNAIPVEVSNYLTERYFSFAFQAIKDKPHFIVSFRDLVEDPVQTTGDIVAAINATGQNLCVPSSETLVEHTSPQLYRSRSDDTSFGISKRLQGFYDCLAKGEIPSVESTEISVPTIVSTYEHSKRFEEYKRKKWLAGHLEEKFLSERQKSIIYQSRQKIEELTTQMQAMAAQKAERQSAKYLSLLSQSNRDLEMARQETDSLLETTLTITNRLHLLQTSLTWRMFRRLIALMLRPAKLGMGPTVLDEINQGIERLEQWDTSHRLRSQDASIATLKEVDSLVEPRTRLSAETDVSVSSKDLLSRLLSKGKNKVRAGFVVTENSETTSAGDFFTAKELAIVLTENFSWECSYLPEISESDDWYDVDDLDILFVLLDKYDISKLHRQTKPVVKIAWVRNWVDRWTFRPWFGGFDLVLCTSDIARDFIHEQTGRAAHILKIAANTERFHSSGEEDKDLMSDYCFTGSFWGAPRQIENLDPSRMPYEFALYGTGWKHHEQFVNCCRGSLPYEKLPSVYTNTKILIDDANHVTNTWASVNSRVFDALATGTLVITNGVAGARETFGDLLPTYTSNHELINQVSYYLDHADEREKLAKKLRQIILKNHSYKHRATQLRQILKFELNSSSRIAIKLPVPQASEGMHWNEFDFGKKLAKSLRKLGHSVRLDCIPDWYLKPGIQDDVVITIRGESCYKPDKSLLNLLWITSHPTEVHDEELDDYDHIFVASDSFVNELEERTKTQVTTLLQCTDPETFKFKENQNRSNNIVYVGNAGRKNTKILEDAIEAGLNPLIVGKDWQGVIDESLVAGEHIENSALSDFYSISGVVLCQHSQEMAEYGLVSNQLFDAIACGAIPVSQDVPGIKEIFSDLVYVYSDQPEQLKTIVQKALFENDAFQQQRLKLAAEIAKNHSFEARARTIDSFISSTLSKQSPHPGTQP